MLAQCITEVLRHHTQNGSVSIRGPPVTALILFEFLSHVDFNDLSSLMEQLRPVTSSWKFLGLGLGLTMGELNEIEGMPLLIPGGPAAFLQEMLHRWLKRAPPFPTISVLCDALRRSTVGEGRVAYNLEQRYLAQKAGFSCH